MSGSAGGLLLVPLLFGVVPVLATVVVGGALVTAASVAGQAASAYTARRANRERIRQIEAEERVGSYRDMVLRDMREETRLNAEASAKMDKELERGRREAAKILETGDSEKYGEYLKRVQGSRDGINREIVSIQDSFSKDYESRIAVSMRAVNDSVSRQLEVYLKELQTARGSDDEKRGRARELADMYLKEARGLLDSLKADFARDAFGGPRVAILERQLDEASAQYAAGRYETCLAVAKDSSITAIEEIYKADARRQEWENYHKLALGLASEIEAYLQAQERITPEAFAEMRNRSEAELDGEIIGVRIADYTDKMDDGQTRFDYLLAAVSKQRSELESATPSSISIAQMKEIASVLNGKIYPEAMNTIYKGILNMSNAFVRQNLSEDIVNFFEEHNFTFSGYSYDGDRHDGALYVGFENEMTGEELVVTLAPEIVGSAGVQTRVSIDHLKGDERNEERREYYRQAVRDAVAEGIQGASVSLECDQSTRNKFSANSALRDKLKR
ncbi:MAG: hypothetical protein LBI74_00225 [Synergistaceae bacterium]|nr:hypothetical protein [Synergistaceae bacterium]